MRASDRENPEKMRNQGKERECARAFVHARARIATHCLLWVIYAVCLGGDLHIYDFLFLFCVLCKFVVPCGSLWVWSCVVLS